jgi:hypothetical protein
VIFTKYHHYPGSKFERLLDWTEVQHAPTPVGSVSRIVVLGCELLNGFWCYRRYGRHITHTVGGEWDGRNA